MKKNSIILSLAFCVIGSCVLFTRAQIDGRRTAAAADKKAPEVLTTANPIVRFTTSQGNIDVELFPSKAPLTVANFLGYVDRGDYNASFIHRLSVNFVLQGGGFKFVDPNVIGIPEQPPVMNEFNLSNVHGTIAMAKISGDPNSATSHWFFNLADNFSLDTENGGFTVFGHIANTSSSAILNNLNAIPVFNLGSPFDEIPLVNYTSGNVTNSNLVTVISISRVVQNTDPGSNITVQGSGGEASVTFTQVAAGGNTSFTPIAPPASAGTLPSGYNILPSGLAFDISTTATVVPPIVSCFTVSSVTDPVEFAKVRILHGEAGVLVDRTILAPDSPAPDFATKRVCARTATLSPFVAAIATAATAAGVEISGRVFGETGRGVRGAQVSLMDDGGNSISVRTDQRGNFIFNDVAAGRSYVLTVSTRRFAYTPRSLEIRDNVTGLEILPDNDR
jgi:peptidyl-prolyl cis-trans isomerase A (cyclophilin A)